MTLREQYQSKEEALLSPLACRSTQSRGRARPEEECDVRTPFQRDVDRVVYSKAFRRLKHKTQVFLQPEGDHYRTRMTHTLEVNRIARTIARALALNEDLTEAIALGHDLGHTPFGHAGERFLSALYQEHTGRYFNHNVHSVRVLDGIFHRNVTLQTLDGILCHNGEFEQQEYRPAPLAGFEEFDARVEACYTQGEAAIKKLVPSTLEGCVVRVCDMIAYLGKDRQDAVTAHIIDGKTPFTTRDIGTANAAIINNMTVDILENSYGKDYILLSPQTYQDLKTAKRENNEKIYQNQAVNGAYNESIRPMFHDLYGRLLQDLKEGRESSPVFRHHIAYVEDKVRFYRGSNYREEEPNAIVTDYLASMTDDYFLGLHRFLFPKSTHRVEYKSYFADLE